MRIRGIVRTATLEENPPGSDRIEMVLRVQGVGPGQPRTLVVPYELLLADPELDRRPSRARDSRPRPTRPSPVAGSSARSPSPRARSSASPRILIHDRGIARVHDFVPPHAWNRANRASQPPASSPRSSGDRDRHSGRRRPAARIPRRSGAAPPRRVARPPPGLRAARGCRPPRPRRRAYRPVVRSGRRRSGRCCRRSARRRRAGRSPSPPAANCSSPRPRWAGRRGRPRGGNRPGRRPRR